MNSKNFAITAVTGRTSVPGKKKTPQNNLPTLSSPRYA